MCTRCAYRGLCVVIFLVLTYIVPSIIRSVVLGFDIGATEHCNDFYALH